MFGAEIGVWRRDRRGDQHLAQRSVWWRGDRRLVQRSTWIGMDWLMVDRRERGFDRGLLFFFFFFFFFGVDGRLWVTGGGGVKCVVQRWWACVVL